MDHTGRLEDGRRRTERARTERKPEGKLLSLHGGASSDDMQASLLHPTSVNKKVSLRHSVGV